MKAGYSFHLRPVRSDILTFHQTITFREYEFEGHLNPAFIIDARANIGDSAVNFACRFPVATILSIEPERGNYEVLLKNGFPSSGTWSSNSTIRNAPALPATF